MRRVVEVVDGTQLRLERRVGGRDLGWGTPCLECKTCLLIDCDVDRIVQGESRS